jgi:peptidoglycan hydrolase-like protein with peptidoglycan-binding domain
MVRDKFSERYQTASQALAALEAATAAVSSATAAATTRILGGEGGLPETGLSPPAQPPSFPITAQSPAQRKRKPGRAPAPETRARTGSRLLQWSKTLILVVGVAGGLWLLSLSVPLRPKKGLWELPSAGQPNDQADPAATEGQETLAQPKTDTPTDRRALEPLNASRDTLKDGSLGPETAVIPTGQVGMGCLNNEMCEEDEKPADTVQDLEIEPGRSTELTLPALSVTADPAASEAQLSLDVARRRQVQAWLTALGHSPGAVDGIFGPMTRDAIATWQRSAGLPDSGYLDTAQYKRLGGDGEAADGERTYWAAISATTDVAVLRGFVGLYPEGKLARQASARIDTLRDAARRANSKTRSNANSSGKSAQVQSQAGGTSKDRRDNAQFQSEQDTLAEELDSMDRIIRSMEQEASEYGATR